MSLESRTSLHAVTVLEPTETLGPQLGRSTTFAPAPTPQVLRCTVVPGFHGSSRLEYDLLRQQGALMPHTLYFSQKPDGVNESKRLQWGNLILRIVSLPRDVHGLGRLWIVYADLHTDDNPEVWA